MQENQLHFMPGRFYALLGLITLAVLLLLWRVTDLAILKQPFLLAQGNQRELRLVKAPAFRGMIVDRNGYPLAVSTLVYSIWINPQVFHADNAAWRQLSQQLHIPSQTLKARVFAHEGRHQSFVYLKRDLPPDIAENIKALNLPGLYLQEAYRRYYPEGATTAHVLGWTNIDDIGQEGLELAYDHWLSGTPGQKWVMKDRLGGTIANVKTVSAEVPGQDMVLSIDRRIQYMAYRELSAGVLANHAASGTALVIDTQTGEILAMVNVPAFNPNQHPVKLGYTTRNLAATDTFEPGSVIKAFTIATALQSGHYRPDSTVDTSPGWMRLDRHLIRDEKNNGVLSLAQILQYSSNMGAAKIALSLPPDDLWQMLHRAGFGEPTGVGFPGEQGGMLVLHHPWGLATLAVLAYGYGLSVTPLQLAQGYMIFANAGIKKPLTLFKQTAPPQGVRVLNPQVANEMLVLLEAIFAKGGTAQTIRIPGYRVAGKTGTAWLHDADGYQKHRYNSSFVGIAPVTHPRLLVLVTIHDPRGKAYLAGFVAGPVFQKIMASTLRTLDIAPDMLLEQTA